MATTEASPAAVSSVTPASRPSTYRSTYPSVQRQQEKRNQPRRTLRVTPEQIRLLRKQMGWSQEELARRLLVNDLAVSRWERGVRVPQRKYQMVLIRWLGLDERGGQAQKRPSL